MSDQIVVTNNVAAGRFEVTQGGEIALAQYRLEPGVIVLPHTEVPDAFAGKGGASALARTALQYARDHGLQVVPTCSFMAGFITKHPEHHDLVHPDCKARLGLA